METVVVGLRHRSTAITTTRNRIAATTTVGGHCCYRNTIRQNNYCTASTSNSTCCRRQRQRRRLLLLKSVGAITKPSSLCTFSSSSRGQSFHALINNNSNNYSNNYSTISTTNSLEHQWKRQLYHSTSSTCTSVSTTINNNNDTQRLQSTLNKPTNRTVNKLRIAIVGGGCAGLSTALHLAELVEMGYVDGPIDIYTTTNNEPLYSKDIDNDNKNNNHPNQAITNDNNEASSSSIGQQQGQQPKKKFGREIGVGLWSTGLEPFNNCNNKKQRESHKRLYNKITQQYGTYIERVGYRIPNGSYLLESILPSSSSNSTNNNNYITMPYLLFLRECDFLQTLYESVQYEETLKNVQIHYNVKVQSLQEESMEEHTNSNNNNNNNPNNNQLTPNCSRLVLQNLVSNVDNDTNQSTSTNTTTKNPLLASSISSISSSSSNDENMKLDTGVGSTEELILSLSQRNYHLIIVADGTNSILRKRYGGYSLLLLGGSLPSGAINPLEHIQHVSDAANAAASVYDRNYTVFRGNAHITKQDMRKYDTSATTGSSTSTTTVSNGNGIFSFQTWGEGSNMRFATVPMKVHENEIVTQMDQESCHRQVWFITIDDDIVINETDPMKRRDMLLERFSTWHDPIRQILLSTPVNEIYMDRAVAHRHNIGPILDVNRVIDFIRQSTSAPTTTSGTTSTINNQNIGGINPMNGPCLVFHGDSYMTIDPILAQGFTCSMEGSYALRQHLECALQPSSSSLSSATAPPTVESMSMSSQSESVSSGFDFHKLQYELMQRHIERVDRLKCLLFTTEIVQALGQPTSSNNSNSNSNNNNNTLTSWWWFFNTKVFRPFVQYMVPNFIKRPIFDIVLKYSLGLYHIPTKSTITSSTTKK